MRRLSARHNELNALAEYLEAQGCHVRKTKQKWVIVFPDGSRQSLHRSASDYRWLKNFRASVIRAGIAWPEKIGNHLQ